MCRAVSVWARPVEWSYYKTTDDSWTGAYPMTEQCYVPMQVFVSVCRSLVILFTVDTDNEQMKTEKTEKKTQ